MKTQRAPEHAGIFLENALPKPIADHGQRRPAEFVFVLGKRATQFRRQADDLKKIRGDKRSADAFRRATGNATEIARLASRNGEMFEDRVVAPPIEVIGKRDGTVCSAAEFIQRHDAIGVRIWQGLQQNRVDHTEDRSVRADPERERHDRDKSEAGGFPQLAEGEAEIAHDSAFLYSLGIFLLEAHERSREQSCTRCDQRSSLRGIAPRFDRDGTGPALQPQGSAAAVDCSLDAVTVAARPTRHRQIAVHATDASLSIDRERGIVGHDNFDCARRCFQPDISRHGRRQFRRNKSTGRFRFQFPADIRERELAAGAFDTRVSRKVFRPSLCRPQL